MFKDTKEGETHSYNDGCGEPAHNPKLPQNIEKLFDKEFPLIRETGIEEAEGVFFNKDDSDRVKSFIATILDEERKLIAKIVRDEVTKYVQEAVKNPKSDNYIYAENIPLSRLDDIINIIKEDDTI